MLLSAVLFDRSIHLMRLALSSAVVAAATTKAVLSTTHSSQ